MVWVEVGRLFGELADPAVMLLSLGGDITGTEAGKVGRLFRELPDVAVKLFSLGGATTKTEEGKVGGVVPLVAQISQA